MPETRKYNSFHQLSEGLGWADATLSLRVQLERHSQNYISNDSDYLQNYGMTVNNLKFLKPLSYILHPGPIHYETDMEPMVLSDPRCLVFAQVENGVYVREALLRTLLEGRQ